MRERQEGDAAADLARRFIDAAEPLLAEQKPHVIAEAFVRLAEAYIIAMALPDRRAEALDNAARALAESAAKERLNTGGVAGHA
jgi:3-methyladenine DNA glycosylase/8-oxoguanine DNA glycosylase